MTSNPKKRSALGKGLGALLDNANTDITTTTTGVTGGVSLLPISAIEANPFNPRTNFEKEALEELSQSIRIHGIIQPLTVRKLGRDNYQLISGERRFRASQLAGLTEVPAYVRVANDQAMLEMALVENIQRHDLDPIEVAISYQRLIEEIKLTQEELSERVGKKRSTITNYLRLLKLDPIIQTGMRDGFISMGHGRALINIDNQDAQSDIYHKVVTQNLSVRETEALVKNYQESLKPKAAKSTKSNSFEIKDAEKKVFANYFGTKVDVKVAGNGKGKISIPFHSEEDFNRILKLIKS